jgi:adenylate cyclase
VCGYAPDVTDGPQVGWGDSAPAGLRRFRSLRGTGRRDHVIGALHVDTPLKVGSFTAEDLDLLTALGNFAAVAIERARLQGRIEREERIRERLSRYHSPAVVEEIASESSALEKVRTRPVSVLFADIVGFTTLAETMAPEAVSSFLTTVFTFAADAVFAQGGTLDKFIGDAVMAFFGAPIVQPDHARRAVSAAAKLVENVKAWNLERVARGEPPVGVRIARPGARTAPGPATAPPPDISARCGSSPRSCLDSWRSSRSRGTCC